MKKVKRVELVPSEEFEKSKVLLSLASLWKKESGKFAYGGDDLKFVYAGQDGELVEREFRRLVFTKDDFNDSWSERTAVMPVKIHYRDGSWEYGLKWWEETDVVYQRNRRLVPLFLKNGYINEESEEIEDASETDKDARVPAWILKLMPRWNERIRDCIERKDASIETKDATLADWKEVADVFSSNYVSSTASYGKVELKKRDLMAPIGITFTRSLQWHPMLTTWKNDVCVFEYGTCASKMFDQTHCAVTVYSYLKSIYNDIHKRRRKYTLVPIADLMVVNKSRYERDDEGGKWVDDEVWNNLDQAVTGNL